MQKSASKNALLQLDVSFSCLPLRQSDKVGRSVEVRAATRVACATPSLRSVAYRFLRSGLDCSVSIFDAFNLYRNLEANPGNVRSEGWLALGDRPEAEVELRPGDLGVGVLVPTFEARQTGDAHHEQAVAEAELHDRRLLGDPNLDPEPRAHRVDARLVAGVEAGLHALGHDRLRLLGRERTLRDRAVRGEHRGADAEAEERLVHWGSPLRSKAAYHAPVNLMQDNMLSNETYYFNVRYVSSCNNFR